MDVIHEHNYYSELTLEWNKIFRYVLVTIYFLLTPLLDIGVYMTAFEVNYVLRVFYAFLAIGVSLVIFIVNYISSSLSSSAHDFTSDLYSFLSNKTIII
jgi:hypothetical protein